MLSKCRQYFDAQNYILLAKMSVQRVSGDEQMYIEAPDTVMEVVVTVRNNHNKSCARMYGESS